MKIFNGKAIYNPSGKAGEYAEWACNFYVGCSHGCTYCFLKKGRGAKVLGGDAPALKKGFKDEAHAQRVFEKELKQNVEILRQSGLFFSFTTDPMLDETMDLTLFAVEKCLEYGIPVKILTKNAENTLFAFSGGVLGPGPKQRFFQKHGQRIAIGFTLTGEDQREPNASPNLERIAAMRKLHSAGFKTFASIEPMIDLASSMKMILMSADCCDLFKIGLESGGKYDIDMLQVFPLRVCTQVGGHSKIYFKDSLLKKASIARETLPANCVPVNYNLFNDK